MIDRDAILQKINHLNPLPKYAQDLIEYSFIKKQSLETYIDQYSRSDINFNESLKLAESPYFSKDHFQNIEEMLKGLGQARFCQLILISAIVQWSRCNEVSENTTSFWSLFDHCLAVGIGAERLCQEMNQAIPEHLFLCGFLHDIGKVVFERCLQIQSRPIVDLSIDQEITVDEAERRILGIDHMEAGAQILRRWNLPQECIDVVRWHHLPDTVEHLPLMLDLVHAADILALTMGIGPEAEGLNYRTSKHTERRLGLKNRMIENVLAQMHIDMNHLSTLWKTQVGENDYGV